MSTSTAQLSTWTSRFGKEYTDRNTLSLDEMDAAFAEQFGVSKSSIYRRFVGPDRLPGGRVLEVGCNIGLQLRLLEKANAGLELHGLEPQSYAIERARELAPHRHFHQGNAFALPFADGTYDLVFTHGVLIHIHPNDLPVHLRRSSGSAGAMSCVTSTTRLRPSRSRTTDRAACSGRPTLRVGTSRLRRGFVRSSGSCTRTASRPVVLAWWIRWCCSTRARAREYAGGGDRLRFYRCRNECSGRRSAVACRCLAGCGRRHARCAGRARRGAAGIGGSALGGRRSLPGRCIDARGHPSRARERSLARSDARRCARAGSGCSSVRAVLAEKPLAMDVERAERLVRMADERDIILAVNYSRRYAPSYRRLASWLESAPIGTIHRVDGIYVRGIKHNGTHWLDLARWLAGEIWRCEVMAPSNRAQLMPPSTPSFALLRARSVRCMDYARSTTRSLSWICLARPVGYA